MDYRELRELVRIRHQLRRFVTGGDTREAGALLSRMEVLTAHDPVERAAVAPEMKRWQLRLGLSEA